MSDSFPSFLAGFGVGGLFGMGLFVLVPPTISDLKQQTKDVQQQAIDRGHAEWAIVFDADGNKSIEFRWKEQQ